MAALMGDLSPLKKDISERLARASYKMRNHIQPRLQESRSKLNMLEQDNYKIEADVQRVQAVVRRMKIERALSSMEPETVRPSSATSVGSSRESPYSAVVEAVPVQESRIKRARSNQGQIYREQVLPLLLEDDRPQRRVQKNIKCFWCSRMFERRCNLGRHKCLGRPDV